MSETMLLISVFSLITRTIARPEVSVGQNPGFSSSRSGLQSPYPPTASSNSYYGFPPNFEQDDVSEWRIPHWNSDSTESFIDTCNDQSAHLHLHSKAPIITKHFYHHRAPVDLAEQQIVRHVTVGRPRKNYRVVFIEAPAVSTTRAHVVAHVAPTEDQTAIYVLSKEATSLDVSAEVVTPAPIEHKPQVVFVKYKTPEESRRVQQNIQAQYDALDGRSEVAEKRVSVVTDGKDLS